MSGRNGTPGQTVLGKAFAILDALRMVDGGLTRAQIARRTGLPMTTVHRLANELRRHGALELTDNGTYRIGTWLWEVGTLTQRTMSLREIALPLMEDLYEATHENVQLAVLSGYDALVIERIRGTRSIPIITRVGGRLPLHCTGVGKVLLAHSEPEFVERVIARGLDTYTPRTVTEPGRLRRELEKVKREGIAATKNELGLNIVSVAAPVHVCDDEVVAALSLVVDGTGADAARLAPPVRAAAMVLSRRICERWDFAAKVVPVGESATTP